MFSSIFSPEIIPKSWRFLFLKPLYKNNGDQKSPDNYRGLAIGNIIFKVFTSVLQASLNKWSVENKKIPQNQFDSVRNRSIRAFDTVVSNQPLKKLKNNGLSTKFHNVLSFILHNDYLRICISNFVSDRIKQNRGLLQGDPISPLYTFYSSSRYILSIFGSCYFYADDLTAVVTDSTQKMTEVLKRLEFYCRENNLTVNISMTKMMKIRKRGHTGRKDIVLHNGQPLKYVNSFENLCVTISAFLKDNVHVSKLHRKGITSVNILAAMVIFF